MRRVMLHVNYNGKKMDKSFMDHVLDFSYTDSGSGELDDLSLRLSDKDRKFQASWMPAEGDVISAAIEVFDWQREGQSKKYNCGSFHVDELTFSGVPDEVSVRAASFPVSSTARQERRTKVWEKVKLSTIAGEIARRAKLKLANEVDIDPSYDRIEQMDKSDFSFLLELTKQEGIACKVVSGQLVLFDESKFERGKSVATFERGKSNILDYSFSWSAANCAYRACEVTYEEVDKKKTSKATYTPPGAPSTGPVLRVQESAKSQADALRIGKNRLREKNKQANLATMTIVGDVRIAAGVIITIKGFGRFDGKYIVDKANHTVGGGGYNTRMDLRKILGW
ncbi:phage late control D family protein [Paenibacillus agilis]|uniref:Late control protein n=1 Tax=Paenibacillus agilis TaxID=3020863 RepID=A0A559IZJ7_9BACL|nr:contractile injection system protein, VgrG/Pvc8 family [Paenibacillus agilis]TVX93051.1 late control protein [Paenibacillus agilis]